MRAFRRTLPLLAALAFAGCGKTDSGPAAGGPSAPPSGAKKTVIGVTLLTRAHIFYQDLEKGLQEAAGKAGIELRVQAAEFDPQTQSSQVDNFIVQKVDALVICPANSEGSGGPIRKANQAGIPVFTADIRGTGGAIVCHIASDNVQGGRLIGEYLAKAIGEAGEVAIIDHPEVTSVQDRTKGFREAIAKFPGVKIVDDQAGLGQRDKAQQVMQNMLQAHPNLKGVFGINDDSALGALAALKSAGKTDVKVVGFDATPEAAEAIRAGTALVADAAQSPMEIGRVTIETIAKHLKGEKVPAEIPIPTRVVDKNSK